MALQKKKIALFLVGWPFIMALTSCIPNSSKEARSRLELKEFKENTTEPETSTPKRSKGLFQIKSDYCLCRGGLPFLFSPHQRCLKVCDDATAVGDQTPLLLGQAEVSDVELNLSFGPFNGDLNKFCHLTLDPENEKNPRCFGQLRENHNNSPELEIEDIDILKDNLFQVSLPNQLREGRIYSFRILSRSVFTVPETGEVIPIEGYTDTIQFQVDANALPSKQETLLKIETAMRYYCIPRTGISSNNFNYAFKQHFIFDASTRPPRVPKRVPKGGALLCHNEALGFDRPSLPRLGEEVAFKIWHKRDQRFRPSSSDGESEIKINELIKKRLREKYDLETQGSLGLFYPMSFPRLNISESGTSKAPNKPKKNLVGFMLKPFLDPDDDFPICPSEMDINLTPNDEKFDPIFDVLREFISATEALYSAIRTPRQVDPIRKKFVDNVFFINESLLNDIWFYYNDNNQPEFLDTKDKNFRNLVSSKTLYFYWPPYRLAPTVRRPEQLIYKVLTLQEIEIEINGDETSTFSPFADRRLGCIPKTDN